MAEIFHEMFRWATSISSFQWIKDSKVKKVLGFFHLIRFDILRLEMDFGNE